jgi:nucleotide-binding universal stress UspA family protein
MSIRILLPHDGSTCAQAATSVALQLASSLTDVQLVVLHVVNVRPATGNFLEDLSGRLGFEPAVVRSDVADAKQASGDLILSTVAERARAAGVSVETVQVTGVVSETVLEHSHDKDLVVMGIRGQTEDRYLGQGGEMSSWLPQRSSTPVLLVPAAVESVSSIAVGWDGSAAARHTLRPVRRIAAAAGLAVHAIHVTPDGTGGTALLDELDGMLDGVELYKHVVQGTRAHRTLVEAAQQCGANVLALGYLGRSKVKDLFFGSSTERILMDQQLAVLVVR